MFGGEIASKQKVRITSNLNLTQCLVQGKRKCEDSIHGYTQNINIAKLKT